ncbi:MAG: hypothetical protein RBR08_16105 [Desulforegulaceae bacterium]|nr:hypothetical protein [Desulforegulaceae bacterium]
MKIDIKNIISTNSEVAFVLESPHTDELFHQYPLAGEAGREVSKFLLDRYDVPFGLIAKKKELVEILNLPTHGNFSIVNISKKPLQKMAYTKNNILAPSNIELLEKLKRLIEQGAEFATNHRDASLNKLKKEMYENFKRECEDKLKKHKILVPCGRFARVFCKQLQAESSVLKFELIDDIPHPSSGWSSLDKDELAKLKRYIS